MFLNDNEVGGGRFGTSQQLQDKQHDQSSGCRTRSSRRAQLLVLRDASLLESTIPTGSRNALRSIREKQRATGFFQQRPAFIILVGASGRHSPGPVLSLPSPPPRRSCPSASLTSSWVHLTLHLLSLCSGTSESVSW